MSDDSVNLILEHLRDTFLDELPSRISRIENEVMASAEANTYDELFRLVHSIKGSAGSYNFHIITKIAHDMEDVMQLLMKKDEFGTRSTIDLLLKFIDIMRDTAEQLISTKEPPLDVDERLKTLRDQLFSKSLNFLVVEPSKLYARLIEHSLNSMDINFSFKDDGMPALDDLLMYRYDILITSLECPRLNGDALVAALRLVHNFNKDIKVVLVSSRDKNLMANKNDFDAILDRKSIKEGDLVQIIKNLLK